MKGLLLAAVLLTPCSAGAAAEEFAPLDLEALGRQAADYRHRAALLRKSAGLREQRINAAQERAEQIVAEAREQSVKSEQEALRKQAQARNDADALNFAAGFLPGGDSLLKRAVQGGIRTAGQAGVAMADAEAAGAGATGSAGVAQAHDEAAPLREQAKALEGDRKKLALKADQYEKLADAKSLLIAAETLRRRAEADGAAPSDGAARAEDAMRFARDLDVR